MKKLLFFFVLIALCSGIAFYLEQSYASSTLERLKMATPKLSEHIAIAASKKLSTLFSLIPSRIQSSAVWGALGRGFYALKPQLETTQWAGEQVQRAGKFSLITAGLAATASSSWLLITFFAQVKKNRAIKQEIKKIEKELKNLKTRPAKTQEIENKITKKQQVLDNLTKKSSLFQRLIRKMMLPAILTLGSASLVGQAYGVGYAGDWLRFVGKTLGSWSIPIK